MEGGREGGRGGGGAGGGGGRFITLNHVPQGALGSWLRSFGFRSYPHSFRSYPPSFPAGRKLTNLPVESGTAVLAQLGFRPERVDLNLTLLFVYLGAVMLLAYTVLARCVKEKR
ncbi:hypothetical protein VYU27_006371 [Nannochloropsis oceanica]